MYNKKQTQENIHKQEERKKHIKLRKLTLTNITVQKSVRSFLIFLINFLCSYHI